MCFSFNYYSPLRRPDHNAGGNYLGLSSHLHAHAQQVPKRRAKRTGRGSQLGWAAYRRHNICRCIVEVRCCRVQFLLQLSVTKSLQHCRRTMISSSREVIHFVVLLTRMTYCYEGTLLGPGSVMRLWWSEWPHPRPSVLVDSPRTYSGPNVHERHFHFNTKFVT